MFTDAKEFGFSPQNSGVQNREALQRALDGGGTVTVSEPGTYAVAGTVFIGSHTRLVFGQNVFLKKVNEVGAFTHLILNRGALTKTYDEHIAVENLYLIVNGVGAMDGTVYGLRGHAAFFYVKDLRVTGFRCTDLPAGQYCLHICTFEDLVIEDVLIRGKKDGIHLGRGKRFTIRDAVFETFDDAIALNGHDYDTANPEIGWIEDGLIENCRDLRAAETTGYFCRLLAGGWPDWTEGMAVRNGDVAVSGGRMYRVRSDASGVEVVSSTRPAHEAGVRELDGIRWAVLDQPLTYTAGVKNVTFRDIFLEKPRTAFSVHFDNDGYSRSYYPGAPVPVQSRLTFENIRFLYDEEEPFLCIATPIDVLTVRNADIRNNPIRCERYGTKDPARRTRLFVSGCVFDPSGDTGLFVNNDAETEMEITLTGCLFPEGTPLCGKSAGPIRLRADP